MNPINKVHLPFLDEIRGVAILAVFLFHSLSVSFGFDNLPWQGLVRDFEAPTSFLALYPFTYGSAGVAIFFVVSGFCIHLSHRRNEEKGWLLFANSRFFRIYPPYFIAVLLFFFLWPLVGFHPEVPDGGYQLASHLWLIHNFDQQTFFGINPSFWSIAVEVQLYLIYPLLLLLVRKLGWRGALVIVGSVELGIRGWATIRDLSPDGVLPQFVVASPFAYWASWAIGAYLCECFLSNRSSRLFRARFDLVALVVIALPLFRPTVAFFFPGVAFLTAIAIERFLSGAWSLPRGRCFRLGWKHLGFLGLSSYSFYLLHQPVINLTGAIFSGVFPNGPVHPLFKYLGCLLWYPVILMVSHLGYQAVERPAVRVGRFVWTKRQR